MSKKKELVKNTFIILLGKICTQFLSFFLMPLYTSILDSADYGTVDLITTYITLVAPVITLQIETALFRELLEVRKNEDSKGKIISSGLANVLIQFILCLVIYFVVNIFVQVPYTGYILFSTITMMLSNLLLQISRGNGDNIGYAIGSVIAGTFTIIFNIIFLVVLDFAVEGMLLSTAIANGIATIFLLFRNKIIRYLKWSNVKIDIQKKLLKYSIPLVPNGLIWWLINVSDRTLITWILGSSANGIYAVSNKFSNILIQFYNVFNLSWTESASLHINDKDRDDFFSDTLNTVIKLFSSLCIMILALLPFVFNLLINESYNEAYIYIPILLFGLEFNIIVSFIGSIYVAEKLTRQVATTSLYAGIINVVINLMLIKRIGIYAAAISTLVAFCVMSIYRIIDVQKYVKVRLNVRLAIAMIFLLIFISVIYYIRNVYLCAIALVFITVVIIYINKDIFSIIKNRLNINKN